MTNDESPERFCECANCANGMGLYAMVEQEEALQELANDAQAMGFYDVSQSDIDAGREYIAGANNRTQLDNAISHLKPGVARVLMAERFKAG